MLRNGKGYAFWMRPLVGPCTELKREREIRNLRTRQSFAFAFVALRLHRPRAWASFAAMCGIVCSSLTPPLQRGERAHLSGFVKRTRPLRCSWHGAAQTKAIRRQCAAAIYPGAAHVSAECGFRLVLPRSGFALPRALPAQRRRRDGREGPQGPYLSGNGLSGNGPKWERA